jgi:Tol biopolymer transport system component
VVNKRIALVDLRSYSTQLVTPSSLAAICPTWSPDGKRIAYLAAPSRAKGESISDAVRRMSLWIMNADGTHQKRLEIGPVADDMGPRWVGDGHYLLFERIQEGPDQDIRSLWMIGVNGQGQRCIVPHIGIDDEEWRSNHFDVWLPQK